MIILGLLNSNRKEEKGNQEDRDSSRFEEFWAGFLRMTVSVFAIAKVPTSASGIHNFSPEIKVLVDTGNLLLIGLCARGGNVRLIRYM